MQEPKINPYTIHPYIIDPTGTGTGIVLIVNRYCSLILYSCTTASCLKTSKHWNTETTDYIAH